MRCWPDKEEALLNEFLDQLGYAPENVWAYRSMLRHFQRFASERKRPLAEQTLRSWLKKCAAESKLPYVIDRATFLKRFLDWLVERQIVVINPFTELRERYECRSTAAIVRALLDPQPAKALEALRPPPRYASHLGPIIGEHVQRMRTLATGILMRTGSSGSTGICSSGPEPGPNPLRCWPVIMPPPLHRRRGNFNACA